MKVWRRRGTWIWAAVVELLLVAGANGSENGIPDDSPIARAGAGWQRLLLNPMEDAASVATGAWRMSGTYVAPAKQVSPKLGSAALTLGAAQAEQAGSKGDFRVRGEVPGQYELVMKVMPFNDQGQVTVTGVEGGPLTIDVQKKDPVKTLRIEATGDKPIIGIQLNNDYGHFRWISCIEVLEK